MPFSSWLHRYGISWLVPGCVHQRSRQRQQLQQRAQAHRHNSTHTTAHCRSLHQLVEWLVEFLDAVIRRSTTFLHCECPLFRNNHPPYRSRHMLVARCSWMLQRASSTVSLAPQQADNGLDDCFDANFRHAPVISRHAATHVVLGDDADQHEGVRPPIVQQCLRACQVPHYYSPSAV